MAMTYLSPGVYVEEVDSGSKPIEGVSTSTTGFVGMTVRGSTTGPPLLVTSFPDFRRQFGGYLPASLGDASYLAYAVEGFFNNLGQLAYIKRVLGTGNSTASSAAIGGGLITRLAADVQSGGTSVQLLTLRGIQSNPGTQLTLTMVKNGITTGPETVTVKDYNDSTGIANLTGTLGNGYEAQYTTVATNIPNPGTLAAFSAADPGAWGNLIKVQIFQTSRAQGQVVTPVLQSSPGNFDTVQLTSANNFYVHAIVEFNLGDKKIYGKIKTVNGNNIQLENNIAGNVATALNPDPPATVTVARTCEFDITASYDGTNETFSFLTLDDRTPNYYKNVVQNSSTLLVVTSAQDDTSQDPFSMPAPSDGLNVTLTGGLDGSSPADADYVGQDLGPGNRSGIQALTDIEDISIVAVPGKTSQFIQNALITHCETLRYRFAVLDPAPHAGGTAPTLTDIQTQRGQYDTKYAAIYYPRISVYDLLTAGPLIVPPSGHMAGIYARVDQERGVYKAPANEVIGGILDLELHLNKGDQDILNPEPKNINVLRDFRRQGRGLRVWGARCITSDTDWKYINVRRLFIFLEASLDQGTQWVVFEPNDERLWARVRQSVSNFLTRVWRDGALMGAKPDQAFFVKCDRTTMTQDDIDNGRLIMIIGVAPVKPAEFVILRIGQWAGGSAVQEL
jgi:phage tail sheath protein FI